MAQKKAHEVERWLSRPDENVVLILIYGPDRGLVSERARRLAEKYGYALDDPFSVVRVDAGELDQQPGRLLEEAQTVSMFAERRLIWLRSAGTQKTVADETAALLAAPPSDARILVEAGDLKKGSALRSAVERSTSAMALPCYADEGRSLDALIDDVFDREKLTLDLEARQILKANLGGDRLASRGELEKLALYCADKKKIDPDDVRTLIGDVSALAADKAVDAIIAGQRSDVDRHFSRLASAGSPPFVVLAAATRQFQALQMMRQAMDREGKSASAAVAAAKPPVFFARRRLVEEALPRWTAEKLSAALDRLQAAVLRTRQKPDVAEATTRQVLIGLAMDAAKRRAA